MSDALEQRVVELETRMAFQEQLIAELNDALTQMRLEGIASAELLKRVLEDLKLTRGDGPGDPALEPPPPLREEEGPQILLRLEQNVVKP